MLTELPDFIAVLIITLSLLVYFFRDKTDSFSILLFDKIFVAYYLLNLLWGMILLVKGGNISKDMFFFLGGLRLTYLPMLFYFVGRVYSNYKLKDTDYLLGSFFKIFLGVSVVGLIIYFIPNLQRSLLVNLGHYSVGEYFIERMTSILWAPIFFAFLMAISNIYFYYQILQGENKLNYVFFCIIWLSLFLTVSRGGLITVLIGFILLSVIFKKWKEALICFALMFVIAAIVSFVATGSFKMLIWIFSSAAETMQNTKGVTRVNLWQSSYSAFTKNPWGYGIGKAGWLAFRYLKNDPDAVPWATDGWYMKISCETGIIGITSYIILSLIYFIYAFRFVISNRNTLVSFFLMIFIMVNAQNKVSNVIDFSPYISLYWFMLGVSLAIIFEKNNAIVSIK
jgi:hypothetical protein